MTSEKEGGGAPPGTLSSQDVVNELKAFKDKLMGMPGAVSDMAKKAKPDDTQSMPLQEESPEFEILNKLSRIEERLASLEGVVGEIKKHLIKESR